MLLWKLTLLYDHISILLECTQILLEKYKKLYLFLPKYDVPI